MHAAPRHDVGRTRTDRALRLIRRSARRTISTLVCVTVAAGTLAAGTVAGPSTLAHAATEGVTLTVAPAAEGILTPGEDLAVTVSVVNATDAAVPAGRIDLDLNRTVLDTRAKVDGWLDTASTDQNTRTGPRVGRTDTPEVPAGGTVDVAISVPSATVALQGSRGGFGPRGLTAELEVGGADVATGRGAVVWSPGADPAPTPVAAVMPLTVPPSASDFVDAEALATYTAPGGTLTRQLDAVHGRPVAVGIDPRIIASIRILGADAPASAVEWLQRLREMPNETFALAWADADVAVQAQAGAATLLAPTDTTYAVRANRFAAPGSTPTPTPSAAPTATESPAASGAGDGPTVAGAETAAPAETPAPSSSPEPSPTPTAPALAPVPSLADLTAWDYTISGVSWPAAGTVTSGDLGVLAASGTTTAILASGDVQSTGTASVGATGEIGDTTVLVTDSRVSALVDQALSAETDEAFGITLAQLSATLAADARAADGHVVVAALERGWAASGGRLGPLLDAIQGLPFADAAQLGAAFATAPVPLQVVDHPEDPTRVQRVADAMSLEAQVDAFAKSVERPELITGQQRMLLLATLANRWRDDPDGLVTVQDGYTAQADALLGSVAITTRQNTVISDTTSLLINVSNELDQPVTVRLSIIAGSGRIRVDDSALVTVPAHGSASARPPITAISNGDVVVTARLTTEDGSVQIGESAPVELFIRAGFEAVVTTLFVAAVALLFGFGLFRSIRKRRRARARQLAGLPEEIDD
ncbi:DUF6049 family protein [Clavibacter sepedonicus]|uniref:Sortase-sorted surface-anchored protein n=1 Tax=Clavibacter sepedonicus TaxID=31964 RepID=B0RDP0_CLASE|nr:MULTISPECIES: DUF6049 family protein [Clavibacter]MBD5381237.1 sortase [Clavibacter sp.]OQJ48588.1 sortase [Clavibacter sepedonicus]OQJ54133.1 sortase [Clavibacter sepedonicus]UUK65670.1 DUF6049 family protein [Clavibacter sepedonicus]CAQ03169.1 putative sortase-sorted surface-anchored protein [Clavibacter sepedonicus]